MRKQTNRKSVADKQYNYETVSTNRQIMVVLKDRCVNR